MEKHNGMELSQELYQVIIQSDATNKVIQMIPSMEGKQEILVIEDGGVLEIGISKEIYLKMFSEVHQQWLEWNGEFEDLWLVYYMTLGYLITTNENHTMIHLHEQVVDMLLASNEDFMCNEFEIITTLLSSRLKRVNKSSSLWFYMKKLTVLFLNDHKKLPILIDRVFTSCRNHFANYYANNFMKWLMGVSFVFKFDDIIGPRLIEECKANLKDVSLWCTLESWLYMETKTLQYYLDEYNTLSKQSFTLNVTVSPHLQQLDELFRWLLNVKCSILYPYKALLRVLARSNTDPTEYHQLLELNLQKQLHLLSQLENDDSVVYTTTTVLISTLKSVINL